MATAQKFMFDLDFDDPEAVARAERGPEPEPEEVEEVEPEIIVPTFSEEELAAAREEAYKEGFEAGRKEAAEATEEKLLATVEAACNQMGEIYNDQSEANREIAKEMISVATAIARKMFPDLNARNALGEIERVVQETLSAITEEPRVQIMVPPELRESFLERLTVMTNRAGFDGKVFVNPDASLNPGDCRIEWSNGAAVRDSEALWEMIDEIVERNIYGEDEDDETAEDESPAPETVADPPAEAEAALEPEAEAPEEEIEPEPAAIEDEEPAPAAADEETVLDQPVTDEMVTQEPDLDDITDDADPADGDEPVGSGTVDPLSPEMQAAILDTEEALDDDAEAIASDYDDNDLSSQGDEDQLKPEQET